MFYIYALSGSQLISDAGFQGEITSISTAAQQIEVFSRVLKSAIVGFLQSSDDWQNSVNECAVSILELFKLSVLYKTFDYKEK